MPRESLQKTIGKFIKTARKNKKMTQQRLALLALGNDCYASKIGRIEKGELKGYTVETLDKILNELGFDFSSLFKD
jgi:transcriptional regulator with XRE-family HTH domain